MLVWLAALTATMIIPIVSLQWGLVVYLIGSLLFPVLWVGEIAVRWELVYCLWMLLLIAVKRLASNQDFYWHRILSRYGLYLVAVLFSTIGAMLQTSEASPLLQFLVSTYGLLRPLLVMFVFLNVRSVNHAFVTRVFWAFLFVSLFVSLLSISQTAGLSFAQKVTLSAYSSPWRTPISRLLDTHGVIIRSTDVFESPVNNAVFMLVALVTSVFWLMAGAQKPRQRLVIYLVLAVCVLAGVTTLSATFLLGSLVSAVLCVIFLWSGYARRFQRLAIPVVVSIVLLILLWFPLVNSQIGEQLEYQLTRIGMGDVFDSRYDSETGIFATTYRAILERPVFGWGLVTADEVFLGDSVYIVTLYRGGLVGFSVWALYMLSMLFTFYRRRASHTIVGQLSHVLFLYTLLLLIVGVSVPSFSILRLQEWYWALVGLSFNPVLKSADQELAYLSTRDWRTLPRAELAHD